MSDAYDNRGELDNSGRSFVEFGLAIPREIGKRLMPSLFLSVDEHMAAHRAGRSAAEASAAALERRLQEL